MVVTQSADGQRVEAVGYRPETGISGRKRFVRGADGRWRPQVVTPNTAEELLDQAERMLDYWAKVRDAAQLLLEAEGRAKREEAPSASKNTTTQKRAKKGKIPDSAKLRGLLARGRMTYREMALSVLLLLDLHDCPSIARALEQHGLEGRGHRVPDCVRNALKQEIKAGRVEKRGRKLYYFASDEAKEEIARGLDLHRKPEEE